MFPGSGWVNRKKVSSPVPVLPEEFRLNDEYGGMMPEYDLIVVGGGPGGCAAAKEAADAGLKVIVLERGNFFGEKNLAGVGLSPKIYRDFDYIRNLNLKSQRKCVYGRFRVINVDDRTDDGLYKERMNWMLRAPTDVSYPYAGQFMVQLMSRGEFYRWFADLAAGSGAEIKLKTLVKDVIKESSRVAGVIDHKGIEYRAPVVIGADGAHSIVAIKSGLRKRWDPDDITCLNTLEFKADPELIEKYYGDVGVDVFMGRGMGGWTLIYRNGIQLGSGPAVTLKEQCEEKPNFPSKSIEDNMKMEWLQKLLVNLKAEPVEYHSHLLPWKKTFPEDIYTDGLMIAGDAAATPEPFTAEGVYQAMYSGRLASQWAVKAHKAKNFSKGFFKQYMEELKLSPVGVDFMSGGTLREFFRQFTSPEFYSAFDGINDMMFYGMIAMAEPHAFGISRVPGIMKKKKEAFRFLMHYYKPILMETYKYKLMRKIKDTKYIPNYFASVIDHTRKTA